LLGRAKITLNLLPTWYDSALAYRWPLVAASRSLLVTEGSLPHAPEYRPGEHYVAAPVAALVDTICDYLDHPEARTAIIERAYQAVLNDHTMQDSVRQIMSWAESKAAHAQPSVADTVSTVSGAMRTLTPSLVMLFSSLEMLT